MHNKKIKNKEKNLQIHYRECITYSLLYYIIFPPRDFEEVT